MRLHLDEGWKVFHKFLDLRLELCILEREHHLIGGRTLHRLDRNLLVDQEILYRRDRSIHCNLHRPLFLDFQYKMDPSLKIQAERNALIREDRLQPPRKMLIQRRDRRNKKYDR